jgi:hypothetical protein
MLSKKGRLLFSSTVVVYWGIAWIISVAIPSLGALFTLVGAAFSKFLVFNPYLRHGNIK